MSKFEREERYIVVKIKDAQHIDRNEPFNGYDRLRDFLKQECIPTREGLVIEKDWPEYEPTWATIERRVTGVQWNGEGLPPVGVECEFRSGLDKSNGWIWRPLLEDGIKVTVIAHYSPCNDGELVAVFKYGDDERGRQTDQAVAGCFRPIRTPEQIAAEEREKAVRDMLLCLKLPLAEATAYDLYDAGYRKQEPK